jgi:hypothetical protein
MWRADNVCSGKKEKVMNCPDCGAYIGPEDVFCGECGRPVSPEATPERPPTPAEVRDRKTELVAPPATPRPRPPATPRPRPPAARSTETKKSPLIPILGVSAVGLVLLCLCLGGVLFWLGSGQDATPTAVIDVSPASEGTTPTAVIDVSSPSKGATPLAVTDVPIARDLVYRQDFENGDGGWDVYSDNDTFAEYAEGSYRLGILTANYLTWGNPDPALDLSDFEIEVDTQQLEGPLDNNLGILIRYQDGDNFYWFEISGDGYYSVDLLQNDEWQTLASWEVSEAIQQGLGVTNRLRVVCRGSEFEFYVNDVYLTSVSDETFATGNVGLAVGAFDEPGVVVQFDNLRVYSLQE